MEAGFNGARLHQKVFEERFLYHADRSVLTLCGASSPTGAVADFRPDEDHQRPARAVHHRMAGGDRARLFAPQHRRLVPAERDLATIDDQITELDDVTRGMFLATKAMDTTRPVLDTSGYAHRVPSPMCTTVTTTTKTRRASVSSTRVWRMTSHTSTCHVNRMQARKAMSIPYHGQPYFVSEFGGIWWNPNAKPAKTRGATASASSQPRRILHALRRPVRRAARRPADVRLLLHPADRRVPGAERHLHLRSAHQVRPGSHSRDSAAPCRNRGFSGVVS